MVEGIGLLDEKDNCGYSIVHFDSGAVFKAIFTT